MSTAKEPTTWTACTGDIAFSFLCLEIDLPISVSHHGNSLFSDVLMYVHKTRHSFNLQCAYDEAVGVSFFRYQKGTCLPLSCFSYCSLLKYNFKQEN